MKKTILSLIIIASLKANAQTPEDALRLSYFPQNGTARNLAVGGAMGSLGGDLNATFVNPAGLGFYKTGELVLSPGLVLNDNRVNYRGASSQNKNAAGTFGPSGVVYGFSTRRNPEVSHAVSFAVTQSANFNNNIHYRGLNNYSSFAEQFAEEFAKSGYSINDVLNTNSPLPYGSAPALYTYLIDTVKVNGVYQVKAAPEYILDAGQAILQETQTTTKGALTEIAFGYAHNSNDKWLWGVSVSIPVMDYSKESYFRETDTSSNTSNHFRSFEYTESLKTSGVGVNARLGVIYRPKEYIRLGFSVQTPTYMEMLDKRATTITTQLENPTNSFGVSSAVFMNESPGRNEYRQITPFRAILSGSYVFREISDTRRQRAFLSADIEYVDQKGSRFGSMNENKTEYEKAYFKSLNNTISGYYKGTFNFRVGGELKFNTIMGRLGFAYYGDSYKDVELNASRVILSGGLGYRDKGFFVDLTYAHSINKDVQFPYRLQDRANTFAATKQTGGTVMATVGVKF